MNDLKKYKIGMRTIKTGLAVSLSMFIASLISLKSPIFVGIGAIMAMQSSVPESFNAGINRMLGTIVGAIVGLVFSYIFPQNFIFLGIGIILVIHIHYILNWKKSLSLSAIVFLAIFLNNESARIPYATNRIIDTFIGITVAVLVNYFIFAPNDKLDLIKSINKLYQISKSMVSNLVLGQEEISLTDLKSQISSVDDAYSILKKDIDINFYRIDKTESVSAILSMLDEIYFDIKTLTKLEITPTLSENNINLLKKLSLNADTSNKKELTDFDIVYNYHLENILNNLLEIEEILEKIIPENEI